MHQFISCCLVGLISTVVVEQVGAGDIEFSEYRVVRAANNVQDLNLPQFLDSHDQDSYSVHFEERSGRILLVKNIQAQHSVINNLHHTSLRRLLQQDPNNQEPVGSQWFRGDVQGENALNYDSYDNATTTSSSSELFESIVGSDDRVKVTDPLQYPYRTMGRVLFVCGGKTQACTGTLIGPSLVVTSAHCIYSRVHGRCEEFSFAAAQQGKWAPFGEVGVAKAITQPQWLLGFPRTYDYGILVLTEDIGYRVGWMSYGYDCRDFSQDLYTAGYPNDLDGASTTMYEDICPNTFLDACPCTRYGIDACPESVMYASTFKHTCDTYLGQSGAPLWTYLGEDQFPQIRGFHAAGFTQTSFDQRNTGVFVGQQMYSFFKSAAQ